MPENTMTTTEVSEHAHKYAHETAGAMWSVAAAYARHYCSITETEMNTDYWPSHKDEFFRWIKRQPIKDWRE